MPNLEMNHAPASPPQPFREALQELLPDSKTLASDDFKLLLGAVRQQVLREDQEARESQTIISMDDWETLKSQIASLPLHTPEEIARLINELGLSLEEAEIENANWAFRHQSIAGELFDRGTPGPLSADPAAPAFLFTALRARLARNSRKFFQGVRAKSLGAYAPCARDERAALGRIWLVSGSRPGYGPA